MQIGGNSIIHNKERPYNSAWRQMAASVGMQSVRSLMLHESGRGYPAKEGVVIDIAPTQHDDQVACAAEIDLLIE